MDIEQHNGYKIGDKIDYLAGDTWFYNYATIIYFSDDGKPVCEMNYPGHDGCRWCHEYSYGNIRHYNKQVKETPK